MGSTSPRASTGVPCQDGSPTELETPGLKSNQLLSDEDASDRRLDDALLWISGVPEVMELLHDPAAAVPPAGVVADADRSPDPHKGQGTGDIEDLPSSVLGSPDIPADLAATMFVRQPKKRRAHVLRDGSLTMVAYGADEALMWHKRVGAFQKAMRGVLGDRRRTFLWSGSVLDSVIGAFLTQNVADHLSSSAFMIMAARYPPPPSAAHEMSDSVDWEAVRTAPRLEIADAIKGRGMQNFLAARIQECLDHIRLVNIARMKGLDWSSISFRRQAAEESPAARSEGFAPGDDKPAIHEVSGRLQNEGPDETARPAGDEASEHASRAEAEKSAEEEEDAWLYQQEFVPQELLSLEWTRQLPPKEAHDFLSSLHGLGRKSVACIVLLTLHNKEFPVDVNVGRIAARLGWIPLDSEEAIESLDDYAPEPEVHRYLHSRLIGFDAETLYELHYQMITLGKVFCNKLQPNCGACPLRTSCEFALNGGQNKERRKKTRQLDIMEMGSDPLAPKTPEKAAGLRAPVLEQQPRQLDFLNEKSIEEKDVLVPRHARKLQWKQRLRLQRLTMEQDPARGWDVDKILRRVPRQLRSKKRCSFDPIAVDQNNEHPGQETEGVPTTVQSSYRNENDDGDERHGVHLPISTNDVIEEQEDAPKGGSSVDGFPTEPALGGELTLTPNMETPTMCEQLLPKAQALLQAMHEAPDPEDRKEEICQQLSWELLGIGPGHLPLARRQAYRQLSRHVHPDRCRHPAAPEVFSALQIALEVLQEKPAGDEENNPEGVGTELNCSGPRHEFTNYAALVARNEETLSEPRLQGRLVLHALAVPWEALPGRVMGHADPATSSKSARPQYVLFLPLPSSIGNHSAQTQSEEAVDDDVSDNVPPMDPTTVAGLVLVPALAALKGRFPLNGTYFQTNEVFLDQSTVNEPTVIPKDILDTCPSCPVFIGHSIHHMSKGMTYDEVKKMFARGHTLFRAWSSKTGHPEPLPAWLLGAANGGSSKPKSIWKNSEQRAAERQERLQKLLERYGQDAGSSIDLRRLLLLPARAPKQPKARIPKAPVMRRVPKEKGPPKRRVFFPNITAAQRCGVCATCRNPGWKKACVTRRAELEAIQLQQEESADGDAAAPAALVSEADDSNPPQNVEKQDHSVSMLDQTDISRHKTKSFPLNQEESVLDMSDEDWRPGRD